MKKPDNVAETPGLLPYGTNVSAPAIKVEDITAWKSINAIKVNHQLQTRFNELKEEYQKLVNEYKWNELVYNAKFSFEPVIGQTYHLYVGRDGNIFLSMVNPTEWNYECVGSFSLDSNNKWNKL
jgi:hypothetical protein